MEKLRAYKIDNHVYPSVTSIISYTMTPDLRNWASRVSALGVARAYRASIKAGKKITQKELVAIGMGEPDRLMKESQVKGTTVHTWAEMYYNAKAFAKPPYFTPEPLPKEYQGYWDSFLRFNEFFDLKAILQEKIVFSHKYAVAGRMDFYGILTHGGEEKRVLVDFKTSNALKEEYGLQLAAYKHCLEEMGYPVDECYILHLRSHGFYEFVRYDDSLEDFLHLRRMFDWRVKKKQPEFELALSPQEFLKTPT